MYLALVLSNGNFQMVKSEKLFIAFTTPMHCTCFGAEVQ